MARAPRRAVAALLAVPLVAACSVGPSTRPPVAVRGADMPAAPTATAQASPPPLPDPPGQNAVIRFADCTSATFAALPPPPAERRLHAECAELPVPVDPARPALGSLSLGVVRVGIADEPGRPPLATRPPLLVLGDIALDPTARHAARIAEQVPADLLAHYTLVGLDRRGTGSDLLDCAPPDARAALLDADPAGFDAASLLDRARAVVQECNLTLDGQLSGFAGAAAVGDVEELRRALGVARLSAVGTGDGASALLDWARSAPESVARLVLDGPADPAADEPARSEGRARSAEAAFDAFALSCTGRSTCPLGVNPRAVMTTLVAALRTRPETTTDGRRLTAGAALAAVRLGLADPAGWPALASAIAAAAGGDPGPLLGVLAPLTAPHGTGDAVLATGCNDAQRRLAPPEITELADRWRNAYPLFGGSAAVGLVACAPWPTGGAAPDPAPPAGLPRVLVVGTAADPNGPQDGSRAAADSLPAAAYLSWQGAGTGAYPRTSCVTALVGGVLRDGAMPDSGVACPP